MKATIAVLGGTGHEARGLAMRWAAADHPVIVGSREAERARADVLVCGDDKEARDVVIALAGAAGMRGIHGGVLANSVAAEALTSVLIFINGRYKTKAAGIRFTGIADAPSSTDQA